VLRKYVSQLLIEAMAVVADIPEGWHVSFELLGSSIISLALVKTDTGAGHVFLEAKKSGSDWPSAGPCDGAWIIIQTSTYSGAPKGFGPLLYDIAMEYATKFGNGLAPDRGTVSDDALKVWDKYMNERDDVTWVQLDDYDHPNGPWATKNPKVLACKNFGIKKRVFKNLKEFEKAIAQKNEQEYRKAFLASPLTKVYRKPVPSRIRSLLRTPGKFEDEYNDLNLSDWL